MEYKWKNKNNHLCTKFEIKQENKVSYSSSNGWFKNLKKYICKATPWRVHLPEFCNKWDTCYFSAYRKSSACSTYYGIYCSLSYLKKIVFCNSSVDDNWTNIVLSSGDTRSQWMWSLPKLHSGTVLQTYRTLVDNVMLIWLVNSTKFVWSGLPSVKISFDWPWCLLPHKSSLYKCLRMQCSSMQRTWPVHQMCALMSIDSILVESSWSKISRSVVWSCNVIPSITCRACMWKLSIFMMCLQYKVLILHQ